MPFNKDTFAENLRAERARARMKQEELASAIGASRSSVAYYESARSIPTLETACKLAEALHVTLDDLLGW